MINHDGQGIPINIHQPINDPSRWSPEDQSIVGRCVERPRGHCGRLVTIQEGSAPDAGTSGGISWESPWTKWISWDMEP